MKTLKNIEITSIIALWIRPVNKLILIIILIKITMKMLRMLNLQIILLFNLTRNPMIGLLYGMLSIRNQTPGPPPHFRLIQISQ